ncbi:DinB family protein [Lacibacter sp. H407]|uniref:DinB family protein n=1 Tax=Lacibacter sp. H407 TaxID=3133423 RepID=UPI0030BB52BF
MLTDTLATIFQRDLTKLYSEIEQYKSEEKLWITERSIANSAGNLCLHLAGNLKTYIGAELGGFAYTRNRDLEFSLNGVPKAELLSMVAETRTIVDETLRRLPANTLQEEYPMLVFAEKTSTEYFLVHLAAHLSYHLGQINYHRRLLDVQK